MTGLVPAPWDLEGKGYLLLFRFDREFGEKQGRLPDGVAFAHGFGCVIVADYASSNVGPYRELLFIPGKCRGDGGTHYMITQIYVSTAESLINGRRNWAIPKERGDFVFTPQEGGREAVTMGIGDERLAEFRFRSYGPRFPLFTALLPFSLCQYAGGQSYHTRLAGRGWGRLAKVEKMVVNPVCFPNICGFKPFLIIKAESFHLHFPPAQIFPCR